MNIWKPVAVAMALALGTPAAQAQTQLPPAVGRPIQQSVKLAQGGNTAAALQQVNAARAAAKTPTERRAVGEAAAYVYTRAGQFGQAARELEAIGAGPRQLAPYYYRAGQYDKAIETAKRAGGQDMDVVIAQSYIKKGDYKSAIGVYERLVKANPRVEYLESLASAQFRAGDKAGYLVTVRQLIRSDPSPARWRTLLVNLKGQNMTEGARLALYQLMRQTGNLTNPADVQDMSKFAILQGMPAVALGALNDARSANVIDPNDPQTQRLFQAATQRNQAAVAALPRLPATPEGRMQAGHVFFGQNRYPQAANAYRQALRGPGADQARVLAGIALVRAGDGAGARQLLDGVPDTSPFNDIAELWSLYAQTQRA